MKYIPKELLDFIIEEKMEQEFFQAMMQHVQGYSIAEITDRAFTQQDATYRMQSEMFALDIEVVEDDIITAIMNKLYVSAFLSRYEDTYQIHFLVHPYPERMKEKFEEKITEDVVHYMILQTIVSLKMDTKGKIRTYVASGNGNQFITI